MFTQQTAKWHQINQRSQRKYPSQCTPKLSNSKLLLPLSQSIWHNPGNPMCLPTKASHSTIHGATGLTSKQAIKICLLLQNIGGIDLPFKWFGEISSFTWIHGQKTSWPCCIDRMQFSLGPCQPLPTASQANTILVGECTLGAYQYLSRLSHCSISTKRNQTGSGDPTLLFCSVSGQCLCQAWMMVLGMSTWQTKPISAIFLAYCLCPANGSLTTYQ